MNRFQQLSTLFIAVAWTAALCVTTAAQNPFDNASGLAANAAEADESTKGAAAPEQSTPEQQPAAGAKHDEKRPVLCRCVGDSRPEARNRINHILSGPLRSAGLEFVETPLKDVITQVQDDYGIPIQIDVAALEENGINLDEPMTVNIHNVSLQSALRLMLNRLNIAYLYQDEVLLITTNDAADSRSELCVYDVQDVIGDDANELPELASTITACVAADSWKENGGIHPNIHVIRPTLLVISQSQATHEQIRNLLATIRAVRAANNGLGVPTDGANHP